MATNMLKNKQKKHTVNQLQLKSDQAIFKEKMVCGRERVTTGEERVL